MQKYSTTTTASGPGFLQTGAAGSISAPECVGSQQSAFKIPIRISKNSVLRVRVSRRHLGYSGQERLPIRSFRPTDAPQLVDGK